MKKYILIIIFVLFLAPNIIFASSLSIYPPSKSLKVGDTFDVSILLDTEGKSINAMQVFLSFPPNLLQVVSPFNDISIVSVWIAPPKFNNTLGTISLEGGIPHGIITSNGTLANFKFKVKSTGIASLSFFNSSKLFLNDGLGTQDSFTTSIVKYTLKPSSIIPKAKPPITPKIEIPQEISVPPTFSMPIPPFTLDTTTILTDTKNHFYTLFLKFIQEKLSMFKDSGTDSIPQKTETEVVSVNNTNNIFFIPVVKFFQEKWSMLKNFMINSGNFVWFIVAMLLVLLTLVAYKALNFHKEKHIEQSENILPQDTVNKLIELKDYRERYGPKMFIFLPTMNFLNFQNVYNLITIILILIVFGLVVFIFFHVYHGRRKHMEFKKSLRDIEKAMHIEFNLLSRDMEQKLAILQKIKMEKELSLGEKELEAQLLKDISSIGKHIRQEFEGINENFS